MSAQSIKVIKVQANQTVVDIAIQEYGVAEGMILVIQANPGLTLTTQLVPGQELNIFSDVSVNVVKELIKSEPYASQMQSLLMQWATMIGSITNTNTVVESDSLEIPKLVLFKEDGKLYAKWISFNTKFLDYNPVIRLFRWTHQNEIKQNVELTRPEYYLRPRSTKWRLLTRFKDDVVKKVEFDCPIHSNVPVEIDIDLDEWVIDVMDGEDPPARSAVKMTRGGRGKLVLDEGDPALGLSKMEISTGFALAIVIQNPNGAERPYMIWQKLTQFRIAAQKVNTFMVGWEIKKIIRLR